MAHTIIQELAAHPELLYRHTVHDYHQMIADGTIMEGEPFELLDGQIVRKIRAGSGESLLRVSERHCLIVNRLVRLATEFEAFGCHIISQQPITLPPRDEPEPDAAIVRGSLEDFATHHQGRDDILCVVEVADSSLPRDRGYKLRLYANAGIPMYVIVNLLDRKIEVYTKPAQGEGRFTKVTHPARGETVAFPTATGDSVIIPVNQLLP